MLERVHRQYLAAGITSVIERGATLAGFETYRRLKDARTDCTCGRPSRSACPARTIRPPWSASSAGCLRFRRRGRVAEGRSAQARGRRRHPDRHVVHAEAVRPRRAGAVRDRQSRRSRVPEPDAGADRDRHRHHPPPRVADGRARDRRCRRRRRARWHRGCAEADARADRRHTVIHGYFVNPRVGGARGAARRPRRHPAGMALQGRGCAGGRPRAPTASRISSA